MAEDDIYNNKAKYEAFLAKLDELCTPPKEGDHRKYWIKFAPNKKYFLKLHNIFAAKDTSFIRRLRVYRVLMIISYVVEKDLAQITERDEIDEIMAFANDVNKSPKTKHCFVVDIKYIWKTLFPEKDERGRVDTTIYPYQVRHLSGKIEKSKEKLRGDRFSMAEFEKLVQGFSRDPRMQCLLTVALESLGRPQELLGRRIKDVEMHDNYAKIYISEHGKEGTGFLRIIDSYYYLAKWLSLHPLNRDPEAWLFLNIGTLNRNQQMKPHAANKLIREKCKELKLRQPITLYSLKRNGVTMMRLRGKSDMEIQHTARWTSTKQLKTYDMSTQEESFKIELIKRGKITPEEQYKDLQPMVKTCVFCGVENGISERVCQNCKRPLEREQIEKEMKSSEERLKELEQKLQETRDQMMLLMEKKIRKKMKKK